MLKKNKTKKQIKIKICGIKTIKDAKKVLDCGVDYIGFVYEFPNGKRSIDKEKIKKISLFLKNKSIIKVAVCVDKNISEIKKIEKYIDVIQLHGKETIFEIKEIKKIFPDKKIWKAIKIANIKQFTQISELIKIVDKVLLDATNSSDKLLNKKGEINLELLLKLKNKIGDENFKKIIIAGGINDKNVLTILNKLKPTVLDLSSGVEEKPGVKNSELLKKFFEQVKLWKNLN